MITASNFSRAASSTLMSEKTDDFTLPGFTARAHASRHVVRGARHCYEVLLPSVMRPHLVAQPGVDNGVLVGENAHQRSLPDSLVGRAQAATVPSGQ
jgi:hypothetical protein